MAEQILDLLGQAVDVGDRVAAAFRDSTQAELRTGTIVGFGERGNKLTIIIEWDSSSYDVTRPHSKTSVPPVGAIEAGLRRFIRIG
jgi:hypothetical protein